MAISTTAERDDPSVFPIPLILLFFVGTHLMPLIHFLGLTRADILANPTRREAPVALRSGLVLSCGQVLAWGGQCAGLTKWMERVHIGFWGQLLVVGVGMVSAMYLYSVVMMKVMEKGVAWYRGWDRVGFEMENTKVFGDEKIEFEGENKEHEVA